jgi:ribosomal protein L23
MKEKKRSQRARGRKKEVKEEDIALAVGVQP